MSEVPLYSPFNFVADENGVLSKTDGRTGCLLVVWQNCESSLTNPEFRNLTIDIVQHRDCQTRLRRFQRVRIRARDGV